jgi:AcrR family transcriptional regulator
MPSEQKTSKRYSRKTYHHGDLATELLRAARVELKEGGLEAFSLRAVAKRAGVSHGAPAHHFKDVNGLLTALAARGYEGLIEAQNARQEQSAVDPKSQLIASGLGYIDFAMANPALFRLMFSSEKPDRTNDKFAEISVAAFNKLVTAISNRIDTDPYSDPMAMRQVMTTWSIVHGLAELVISGRAEVPLGFGQMTRAQRDAALADIMRRALG